MHAPTLLGARSVAPETFAITAYLPVPGLGGLPVNAFVVRGREPMLVDTGLAALEQAFMTCLRSVVAPADLRWIWVTHTDADHVGNLAAVLAEAPSARVVTTFLGMGKLRLLGVPVDRVYLLNPGQTLDAGGRRLVGVVPPTFDAPETTAVLDTSTRVLFSADCFGALLQAPAESAREIPPGDLREGLVTWSTVDAPWLHAVERGAFGRALDRIRALEPDVILGSHLPPAPGLAETLLRYLASAPDAAPFVGPDQRALEAAMAAA